jgi:exo-1,4-beta-D-glucosaminidase
MRLLAFALPMALLGLVRPDCAAAQARHVTNPGISRIDLRNDWAIQSSAQVPQKGEQVSTGGFDTRGWYRTSVPSTVVSALVSNNLYPDPYFGSNLRLIPGTTYDYGDNFAVDPMPSDSPFAISWWYRAEFKLSRMIRGRRLRLNFDSINYRANIWLNGRRIADSGQVRGMYRRFEFDVTDIAVPGANALAVEVFAPTEHDLSISFVDWNPLPADKDMGLVRDVYILAGGPVAVRSVQVLTKLNGTLDEARLTLAADLRNAGDRIVEGTLKGTIGAIAVSKNVRLAPGESARIEINPEDDPQLVITNPQLWWPYGLGPQNLYQLHMEFDAGGAVSDAKDVQFGIREVTSELDAQQHRLFRINGERILIRGAAWTPDMMLRTDEEREENEIGYARDMHLNAIRLEGRLEMTDHFFDTADRYGVMIMPGWCCCSYWEQWEKWTPDDYTVAGESLRDQVRRLRNHASVFVFLYGSDNAPPPQAEQIYLKVLQEEHWPNPYLASATDATTPGAGRTGVKMTGPYDYVAPSYWLLDKKHGGAWGFITETSPGPAIPVLASLEQMLPKEHLWPVGDDFWNFHAGSGSFADVRNFTAALEGRYGKAKDLADYVLKSQVMTYEAERAMFEAYGRNKYTSTGVIQWMLNNAWPGLIWHLYDWYLRTGGGYFGTKKANEPVHVQYSYDDGSIVVVNSLYRDLPGFSVTAKVYNMDLTERFSRTASIDITEDSATRVFVLPQIDGLSRTYFVRLTLSDPDGKPVSSNFYWLSTQPDVTDFDGGDYRFAPIVTYADLTGLQNLPPAKITVTWRSEQTGTDQVEHVVVRNSSSQLAFFVHLTVLKGKDGGDIAPVYWEDNYFELMPGEEREVTATYPRKLLGEAQSYIQVDGWNVAPAAN